MKLDIKIKLREGGCVDVGGLDSRILKGVIENLKKLELGFELKKKERNEGRENYWILF